ncbi:MAG: AAA family ATPase [Euryarchaeota archaeon]|jgi:hypothetical protein|uniref:AAA family ATPase n=1 Tax=Methanobacterium sp. MZD130B TaxID=3394378 RepID=UPI0017659C6B|nr:AAA family ATPase [Euryarchaeota archaeon]HHT19759.1 AAA family ATPase [Methanobacterium sp.]
MTPSKKSEKALGKGLDALIRKEKSESTVNTKKSPMKGNVSIKGSAIEKPKTRKVRKTQEDPYKMIFEGVVLEVRKNPRISLWSAKSAAVFRFLKKTKPAFSISKEASVLIEEAVQQKYPEIWELFEDEEF